MNNFSSRFLALVLCYALPGCVVVGAAVPGASSSTDCSVRVTFSIPESRVTLHEPIYMLFAAHNGLSRQTTIYLGKNENENFQFTVIDPRGSEHRLPPLPSGGMGTLGIVTLAAGETYRRTLLLNKWYAFDGTGRYAVEARLVESPPHQPERVVHIWSSPQMMVSIRPRDAVRLRAVCQRLLNTALASSNYETSYPAASALGYIRDPVALPYLGELLGARDPIVAAAAVPGLVRIDPPEAVRILRSNLSTRNPSLRLGIEGALEEIKTGIHPSIAD